MRFLAALFLVWVSGFVLSFSNVRSAMAQTSPRLPDYRLKVPLGLKPMKIPKENRLSAEKIELGKKLFFDQRLSRDDTVSCASCHDPEKGWSNGEAFATGVDSQIGGRNSPTILNSGYSYFQFWDGRATHVEGQALGPIENPIEMDLKIPDLVGKLNQIEGYRTAFQKVFQTDASGEAIAKALGAFERTINSGNAPFDQYEAGDKQALTGAALRGKKLFFGKAHCSACHSGPNFTDGAFHNLGVGQEAEKPDPGRVAISKLEGDTGAFKTPTLREIARTAPYMHNGSLKTLEEVVEFYDQGGLDNKYLDEEIFPLELTAQEKANLVEFMKKGLASDEYPNRKPPELPK